MKKALGKGLSSLIPDSYTSEVNIAPSLKTSKEREFSQSQSGFKLIPTIHIRPNHDQPRKDFSPEGIEELAMSIKEKGVLQPIVVKKLEGLEGEEYELVCGERRLRAATLCGLTEIPAVVKDVASDDFLEWALIENVQREDLNPIEEAKAYSRLAEERMLSQDEIARRVGKDRTTVTNSMRLLRLPQDLLGLIASGMLSAGHARALLGMLTPEHQRQLAKRIAEENLSVRQVEQIVHRSNIHRRKAKRARHLSPEIIDLENRMSEHLGTQVKIFPKKNGIQGRMEMHYFSLDDLDRILEKMGLAKQ